jgi:hypothetical protein
MDRPKKQSRWVRNSGIPRYDESTLNYILKKYREADGWFHGARVTRRSR